MITNAFPQAPLLQPDWNRAHSGFEVQERQMRKVKTKHLPAPESAPFVGYGDIPNFAY